MYKTFAFVTALLFAFPVGAVPPPRTLAQADVTAALGFTPATSAALASEIQRAQNAEAGFSLNLNGTLTTPTIVSGTLVTPRLTLDGTPRAATSWLNTGRAADKNVFIGGASANYCAGMANAAGLAQMLAMGNIGLYQHANGNALCGPSARVAIWATWGITGVTSTGQGQTVGEVGGFTTPSTGYLAFFGGRYPNEVNMNITTGSGDGSGTYTAGSTDALPGTVYTGFTTPTDLATTQTAISAANTDGAKNVAVFLSPNGGGEDLDDPFATAPFWANVRAIALFGGGLALDVPPSYAKDRPASYVNMIAQMITWAVAQHIRVSLTVSPFAIKADSAGNTGFCGFDPVFYENTQWLIGQLAGIAPPTTQWIVENYGGGGSCTGNDIQVDGTPESLNAVALLLARTIATSPPGTAPAGSNGVADAGLMSSTAPVAAIAASLSQSRVGPLRLADILGYGDMATQNSNDVQISGGNITGKTSINVTATPLFQNGILLQGVGGATLVSETHPNEVDFTDTVVGHTSVADTGGFTGLNGLAAWLPQGAFVSGNAGLNLSSVFSVSGTTFAWNLTNTQGELDVLLGKATTATAGGVRFYAVDPTTGLLGASPIASLSQGGVWTAAAGTGAGTLAGWSDPRIVGAAPTFSPALTGTPTAPTASPGTNTTQLATTAFGTAAVAAEQTRALAAEVLKAPTASPTFTGTMGVPTVNTTNLALLTSLSTVAAGTTITDALALTTQLVVIRTCAASAGVKLAGLAQRGVFYMIRNRSGNTCNVYPDGSTHTIEALAAGAPYPMPNGEDDVFFTDNTTNWTK